MNQKERILLSPDNETQLNHILKKNYFEFNNETYLQISGTVIGTRCASNYAIIFMAEHPHNVGSRSAVQAAIAKI